MTLICRPPGRGNWRTVTVTIDRPADLFVARAGTVFELLGRVLRVCEVRP